MQSGQKLGMGGATVLSSASGRTGFYVWKYGSVEEIAVYECLEQGAEDSTAGRN